MLIKWNDFIFIRFRLLWMGMLRRDFEMMTVFGRYDALVSDGMDETIIV